jgi:hypothetical protein
MEVKQIWQQFSHEDRIQFRTNMLVRPTGKKKDVLGHIKHVLNWAIVNDKSINRSVMTAKATKEMV